MLTLNEAPSAAGRFEVAWKQPVRDGRRLKLTLVFPEACSGGPVRQAFVPGALVEHWTLTCPPGGLDRIGAEGLDRTLTDIFVELNLAGGETVTGVLRGGAGVLDLGSPAAGGSEQGLTGFLRLGIDHILLGYDHLLFVLGLVALVRIGQLVLTLTAFTIGHSVTLALAALAGLSLPGPPVEIVIALSLVLLAVEGAGRLRGREGLSARFPWTVAAGFGLVHGFGFAGALQAIGLPEGRALWALGLFNLGVEIGQLIVVAAVLAIGWALSSMQAGGGQGLRMVAAYLVGTAGAYWVLARSVAVFA